MEEKIRLAVFGQKRLSREGGIEIVVKEDQFEFEGFLSAEKMKRLLLESNVFVCPSSIENSPNSLGEAMLLGVPCVASDVGGIADMCDVH